jgi:predicted  nucleic acid-binding Zn-ribbon protein
MEQCPNETHDQSIKALESTLNKLTRSYHTMSQKGANTTLVQKRMKAVQVGLDSLKKSLKGEQFPYDEHEVSTSIHVLQSLIPSIEKQITNASEQSSRKTLADRRLRALHLAIQSLSKRLG